MGSSLRVVAISSIVSASACSCSRMHLLLMPRPCIVRHGRHCRRQWHGWLQLNPEISVRLPCPSASRCASPSLLAFPINPIVLTHPATAATAASQHMPTAVIILAIIVITVVNPGSMPPAALIATCAPC